MLSARLTRYSGTFFRYALFLVVATMPFNNLPIVKLSNSYAIVLLIVAWVAEGRVSEKFRLMRERPLIILFGVFYLLFWIGMIWTSNTKEGLFDLEQKSFLFILPLVIGTSVTYGEREKYLTLKIFVATCLLSTIICLVNAFSRLSVTGDPKVFYYLELASSIHFHPPYFGMYIAFSILIIFSFLFRDGVGVQLSRYVMSGLAVYLFCFMILLSARMATIFLVLVVVIGVIYYFVRVRKVLGGVLILMVIFSLSTLIISKSQYLKDRIVKPLTSDISITGGGGETGLSIRLVKWKCSLEGFFETSMLGVGTGDGLDYLFKCYEKENFWGMHSQYQYNSHNQYLQTALTLGLPGVLALLACLGVPFVASVRRNDYLFLTFIALFSFCGLTESLLERQWGLVFAAFFIPLFYFGNTDKQED